MTHNLIRKAAVAGMFYPKNPSELRNTALQLVRGCGVEPAPDRVVTVVTPHAGYVYSGPTAGYAFARVQGKTPKRVILLGCSHRYYIDTVSVCTGTAFDTPLGSFPVDLEFANELAHAFGSTTDEPHMLEHALEVQLPFLAVSIGLVPIVPVLFGSPSGDWHGAFGEALARMVDETDLVVASTDLSHYLSERQANAVDSASLEVLMNRDWRGYSRAVAAEACSMCGAAAVTAAMAYSLARHADAWRLLDYRTSGAASGDLDRVVGYAAVSMEIAA